MSFSGLLTLSGIALTIALLETVLESMGKEKYAKLLNLAVVGVFTFYGIYFINDLMTLIGDFLSWL